MEIENKFTYSSTDDRDILLLIDMIRKGIEFKIFNNLVSKSPFSLNEWSKFLHLSQRTIQRYKKERRKFNPIHSEKILEITLLYKKGIDVFGDIDKFSTWLNTENITLGGVKPVKFLDNSFGINMLKDSLNRIEHGILA